MGYIMNITRTMRCAFVQTRLWGKIMIEQRDISGIFCIIQKGDDILFFAIPHFVPSQHAYALPVSLVLFLSPSPPPPPSPSDTRYIVPSQSLKDFVDGNMQCNFHTFIRPNQAEQLRKFQQHINGRNPNCGPAIPVKRSNQLSYRGTCSCRALTTSSCTVAQPDDLVPHSLWRLLCKYFRVH